MKAKLKEISLFNVLLCFFVILIHLTSTPLAHYNSASLIFILFYILNRALCFCVPAFLFLSGFKLRNKYAGDKFSVIKFYLGRLKKIVLPYLLAAVIYFSYYLYKNFYTLSAKDIFEGIILGKAAAHFYYIMIIVQIYLLFPLLINIFERFPKTLLIVSFISSFVFKQFVNWEYTYLFFASYIFYFVLGMYFAKYILASSSKKKFIITLCSGLLLFPTGAYYIYRTYLSLTRQIPFYAAETFNLIYVSCAVILLYGILGAVSGKLGKKLQSFINVIGSSSYYIYLYHILLLQLLQFEFFTRVFVTAKINFLISFAVLYSVSIICAYLRYFVLKKINSRKAAKKIS